MAVIKHEVADLRRHVRVQKPIGLRIGKITYTVSDWSLGGCRIDDFQALDLSVGDRRFVQFRVPYCGLDVSFAAEVDVVRVDRESSTLALQFVNLSNREKEVLGYAMLPETRNGERASLIDALARIDIPVSPTLALPTAKEAPVPGRLNLRRMLMSGIYWTLGLALGLFIAITLYWYAFRLDLEYSVVAAPLAPVISQDVARFQELFVKEGDLVKAGQPLFRVEDDVLTRDLEIAQTQADVSDVDLRTARAQESEERAKLSHYQRLTEAKLQRTRDQVKALKRELELSTKLLDRLKALVTQNASTPAEVDKQDLQVATIQGSLGLEESELRLAEQSLEILKKGDFYDGRRIVGDLPQSLLNVQDALERQKVAADRVKLAHERSKRLTYLAPFDGRVVKVLKATGGTVARGEPLAILEKAGEKAVIDCFATQDEVNCLSLGATASLWIPALEKTYVGKIVQIDRTSGFLTEMQSHAKDAQARYNSRAQDDYSAYVQIAISDQLTPSELQELTGGMPVIVSLKRTPSVLRRLESIFKQ